MSGVGKIVGAVFPVFGAATLAAGGGEALSYMEQRSAARRSERRQAEANRTEQASSQIANARARRQAIARARMIQAQNLSNVQQTVSGSSALSGTTSALASGLAGNIGQQLAGTATQGSVFGLRQDAANIQQRGQMRAGLYQSLGNLSQNAIMGWAQYGPTGNVSNT